MKSVDLISTKTLGRGVAELALIVVGILIALGVDGWLNEREEIASGRESLELIRNDLALLIDQAEELRAYQRVLMESVETVEEALARAEPVQPDTALWLALNNVTGRRTVRFPRAAYDELVGTGNLRLIRNADVRRELVQFYEELSRDERVFAQNNLVFTDGQAVDVLFGEGLVLPHSAPLGSASEEMPEVMREAQDLRVSTTGPTFEGRLWGMEFGNPLRTRARAVSLSVAGPVTVAMVMSERIQARAESLLDQVVVELDGR